MNIDLNLYFDCEDFRFQEFLADDSRSEFDITYMSPDSGFELYSKRTNEISKMDNHPFLLERVFEVEKGENKDLSNPNDCPIRDNVTAQGKIFVDALYVVDLDLQVEQHLYVDSSLSTIQKDRAKDLFQLYRPQVHGEDFNVFIRNNMREGDENIKYQILGSGLIKKTSLKRFIDFENRNGDDALSQIYNMYCGGESGTRIHIQDPLNNPDARSEDFGVWASLEGVGIRFLKDRIPVARNTDLSPSHITERPENSPVNITDLASLTESVLNDTKPPNICNNLQKRTRSIATLFSYPEFRITWKRIEIKIGCSTIKIRIPIPHVRRATIKLFGYYAIQRNISRAVVQIAESCLISSALKGAVIGIAFNNLAAAIASFEKLFKLCVSSELRRCVYVGLFIVKETSEWRPSL